jgi:hypothetical protein
MGEIKQMMHSALRHRQVTELSECERRIFDLLSSDPDVAQQENTNK